MFINSTEEVLLIICSNGRCAGAWGVGLPCQNDKFCPQGASCPADPENAVTVIRSNLGGSRQNYFESLKRVRSLLPGWRIHLD